MDAISLHSAGFTNVVASMGTAFSEEQAKLLSRSAKEIVFCYDSDRAGRNASVRAVSIVRKRGLAVRVAVVPGAKDPDEYVRTCGADSFRQVLQRAVPGLQFQLDEVLGGADLSSLTGKVVAVQAVLPFLKECSTDIELAESIRKLAERLTIDEGLILDEYRRAAAVGRRSQYNQSAAQSVSVPVQQGGGVESIFLGLLLQHPEFLQSRLAELQELRFTDSCLQKIYELLRRYASEGIPVAVWREELSETENSLLTGLQILEIGEEKKEKIFVDCLCKMRNNQLQQEYLIHAKLAGVYESQGDARALVELRICQEIREKIAKMHI